MANLSPLSLRSLFWALALLTPAAVIGQTLFSDDFQSDTSANWAAFGISGNGATTDYTARFNFDYSTQAYRYNGVTNHVPPSPNSGGTTRGLKVTVNKNGNTSVAAVSLYPIGQSFSNNYSLKFDLWTDYSGDIPFGDGGSTEFASFGLNHLGTEVNWPNTTQNGDGEWFSVTADGGAGADFNAYVGDPSPGPNINLASSGGFLDRDGDGTPDQNVPDPGFSPFQIMFPAPPGQTLGAIGKQWVQVELRQQNDVISWLINGYLIAQHPNDLGSGLAFTNGNIMLGCMDPFNAELPDEPYENYCIFDNVRVVNLGANEPAPLVSVVATDNDASEPGANTGTFTVTRTGSATNSLTVNLRLSGTASNGVDYAAIPSTVTFLPGASATNITVSPLNDSIGEPVETVMLSLVGNPNLYDVGTNYAIVNLTDDSDVPSASVAAARPSAYENRRAGKFSLVLSNPNSTDTTMHFTLTGSAANGVAYSNVPNTVIILAGETNAFVTIDPINNLTRDGVRTVILTLTAGSGYALGSATNASESLLDDDVAQGPAWFADNFETNSAPLWTINRSQSDGVALFGYDYSADGIPPAPNSAGGTTLGLKLQANDLNNVASGVSVSPIGQGFSGDYRLRFDCWINYNGPLFDGGSGSTEFFNAGIGTKGITPEWSGGGAAVDGLWFACDGDGGNGLDYRVYRSNTHLTTGSNPGMYPAGSQAVSSPYYASFGGDPAPAAQIAAYPSDQTGFAGVGNAGFAWHDAMITKINNTVTWVMDGILIATVNASAIPLSTNIFVGFYDPTSGVSPIPALAFSLVDNLRVLTMQSPVITSIKVIGANVQIDFTGATIDTPASFTLQTAAPVNGSYTDASSTITQLSPGSFRAVRAVGGQAQFYRLRR